ncbi:MAG: hypothetical protein IKD61_09245 [Oscillospiraceae bacterium]|nr:hypothetical protein [Oscillospiraceae bacterium]
MESEKLSDSEVLERLIYKAFVSPDKFLPRDTGDALLAFAMAMRLYNHIRTMEMGYPIRIDPKQGGFDDAP